MTRCLAWLGFSIGLWALCGCSGDPGAGSASSSSGAGGSGGAPSATSTTTSAGGAAPSGSGGGGGQGGVPEADPAEAFFRGDAVATIAITLSPGAVTALSATPKEYVQGDVEVTLDGETIALPNSGVRLKGNYGSFRPLDQKAAFLLSFDKYEGKQRLFGMEKLAVNNLVQDASMVHERLAYKLFRGAGAPAPRSSYARVLVNGALYGLYSTVEVIDNKELLERWFGDAGGALYEGSYGSDIEVDRIPSFDQDNGPEVGKVDLYDLAATLDSLSDPATFYDQVQAYIDMESYLSFAATEIFLGHWDGYAWTRNNFFLYDRPSDGRWVFLPWGPDQTFGEHLNPFGGEGRLEQMCDASLACRLALRDAFLHVIEQVDVQGLKDEAVHTRDLIQADMLADPKKEYDSNVVAWAFDDTLAFLDARGPEVAAQLACADPDAVDADMDGANGCGEDCDDQNPNKHPGAMEACNFEDDNCNGSIDEVPECPTCVPVSAPWGANYDFCFLPTDWASAEAQCVARGGHLASVHSEAERAALVAAAYQIAQDNWWIGLTDAAVEGTFTWTDGTPLDFTAWSGGEPNNSGGVEDCGHLWVATGGFWNDATCDTGMRFICRVP